MRVRHARAFLFLLPALSLALLCCAAGLLRSAPTPRASYTLFTVLPAAALPRATLYNALKSWALLQSAPQRLVLGPRGAPLAAGLDLPGLGVQYAPVLSPAEASAVHLPAILPRLLALSSSPFLVYVDPVSILTQAFAAALSAALDHPAPPQLCLLASSFTVHIQQELPFYYADWLVHLLEFSTPESRLDFTVLGFSRAAFVDMGVPDVSLRNRSSVVALLQGCNAQRAAVVRIVSYPTAPLVLTQVPRQYRRPARPALERVPRRLAATATGPLFRVDTLVRNTTRLLPRALTHGAPSAFVLLAANATYRLVTEPHTGTSLRPADPPAEGVGSGVPFSHLPVMDEVSDAMDAQHAPDSGDAGADGSEDAEGAEDPPAPAEEDDFLLKHMAEKALTLKPSAVRIPTPDDALRKSAEREAAAMRQYDERTFTLFATPKPMTDPHIALIQTNAVRSWAALSPRPHILLFGSEPGVKELAALVNATHIPELAMVDGHHPGVDGRGWPEPITPSPALGPLFHHAMDLAPTKALVFINADILLPPLFADVVVAVNQFSDKFLLLSHRYRKWIRHPLPFERWDWFKGPWTTCEDAERVGGACAWQRDSDRAVDYFGFTRQTWLGTVLKDFAVGRVAYDNWLVYHAAANGAIVVGATEMLRVIHQNHFYTHLQQDAARNEKAITGKNRELFRNPLSRYNRQLIYEEAVETGVSPSELVAGDQTFHTFKVVRQKKACKLTRYWNPSRCKLMLQRVDHPASSRVPARFRHPPYACAVNVPPQICRQLDRMLK
eukprot:EG_transcript_3379